MSESRSIDWFECETDTGNRVMVPSYVFADYDEGIVDTLEWLEFCGEYADLKQSKIALINTHPEGPKAVTYK